MRTKTKGILAGLLLAALAGLLGLLVLFSPHGATTASAAETVRYNVIFDYKWYYGNYLNKLENPSKEETNVLKTEALRCVKNINTTCELAFEMYGSSHSSETDVFVQGGTIKSDAINITCNSRYDSNSYVIKNSSDNVVASSTGTFIQATLADGTYYVTFTGEGEWVVDGNIRDVPGAVRIVCTFYFKVETHTHSYTATVTQATCTSGGYTTYQCSCGDSYTSDPTDELGHSISTSRTISCTEETVISECSRCDYRVVSTTEGYGHSYAASTVEASCTEGGYTLYRCTNCGDSYQDNETQPLGHSYTPSVQAASCTEGGYTLFSCSRCDHSYRSGETQATGHSYIAKTQPATCTEGSYTLYECSRCGSSYSDNVSQPLGHNFVTYTVAPSCTDGGKTVYRCQICDYEMSESDGTYPKGHDYTNTILKGATCSEDGIRESVCDNCGDTYETKISALGHTYELTAVQSSNGNTKRTYTCSTCGESYTQELGNQYEEVSNYIEYLFEEYSPYMIWVFLATAGVWSIVIGVALIIARKNEDKEKAKRMLVNYVVGLVIIFAILVATPLLVRGIAALVT